MKRLAIKVSKDPEENWKNNAIQFPRLIAELEACGCFDYFITQSLCASMDVTENDICELIERAQKEWDKIKKKTTGK